MHIEMVVVYLQLYSKNAPIDDGSSHERLTQKAYDLINYHYIHVKPWIFLYLLVIKFVVYETSVRAFACIT